MIVKLAFAFGAGFISFLTPCVLPIIPGYISYISGKPLPELEKNKNVVLLKTIIFSLGFSLVFICLFERAREHLLVIKRGGAGPTKSF